MPALKTSSSTVVSTLIKSRTISGIPFLKRSRVPGVPSSSTALLIIAFVPSASKWKLPSSPFSTVTLLRSSATSVGDAMRDLDNRDLITGDFLLVSGDVVSNLPLESALAKHRARREKDKNAIMTMVLREAGNQHRTKRRGWRPVFVIAPVLERCLHYEEMSRGKEGGSYVSLDPELLSSHGEIEVREDLIDCYVDICTPDVLGLWSDNFDYQSVRKSFLFGVLKDYELNGKTIHTYVIKENYAARARSLRAYDAISKDVISRWAYPLCPDSNLVTGQNYKYGRGKVYAEEGVVLARSSVVKSRSVVGKETSIGDGSVVGDSVLGRRCQIGKNVVINGAYIWDDAVVGDGSVVDQAIVANEAMVGRNCKIEPGALISYGVRIADNRTVPGTSRITRAKRKGRDTGTQTDIAIVGQGGTGYSYSPDSDDNASDASSTDSSHLVYTHPSVSTSTSSISTLNSIDSDNELLPRDTSRHDSFRSDPSDDATQNRDFHLEATASILDGMQKGDPAEVILLELNPYRMAVDASQHEVRHAVVASFMKRISNLMEGDRASAGNGVAAGEAVKMVFGTYKELVERTIFDKQRKEKSDQVDFLTLVQRDVAARTKGKQILFAVLEVGYDLELVEEEGVMQWWGDGIKGEEVREMAAEFVRWLREAEEDDSDDDESEEGG